MVIDPRNEPAVPINETPPEVPACTFFPEMISIGFDFESFPSSVPQVSEFAAATEAKKQG